MTVPNDANEYLPGVIAIPSALTITAITQSSPMIVSVSANPVTQSNTYITGQCVRLNIPVSYGMWQANGLTAKIISTGVSTLTLNVDSSQFDAFVIPPSGAEAPATVAPAGSQNLEFSNLTSRVPFQNLNNIGN